MLSNLEWALILLGFAVFFIIIAASIRSNKKRKSKWSLPKIIGIALIGFGIYEFPLAVMELYEITQEVFHLSFTENYLLWIFICIACIAAGIALLKLGRRK